MDIKELLTLSIENRASDLHLSAELPPMIRVDGELQHINFPILSNEHLLKIINELMSDTQRKEFNQLLEIDFSFAIIGLARFRVNVFNHLRGIGIVFRIVPFSILTIKDLNLPPVCEEIVNFSKGLVLVTGPTGSGKSTTLAAMLDCINSGRNRHIITIEDPIEFVHQSKRSLMTQREIHKHTQTFSAALRSALREDPDVIMIGELRDLETVRLAITAAETGHLVFATLHTNSAMQAIHRIIDVFPAEEKSLIRTMLAESLQAVVAQTLVKKNKSGRVAALEIMLCNAAIRHLIREDKITQMVSYVQTGQAKGMQTLDQHLIELVEKNVISKSTAYHAATDKTVFSLSF